MNEADISDILPTIEEQGNQFVDIVRNKAKEVVESTAFQKIFYKKRSMKQLLQERTALCIDLALTSSRKQNNNFDRNAVAANFSLLFRDCPSQLDQYCWTILQDRGTLYGFLASQDKFVPHCKGCSSSVYVSFRGATGRITCSNTKCKIKLLSELELATENRRKTEKKVEVRQRESRTASQIGLKIEEKKVETTLQQRQLIKKAARRIVQ